MNQDYKVSTGSKIFYLLLAASSPIFSLHLYSKTQKLDAGLLLYAGVSTLVAILIPVSVLRGRIRISPNSIIRVNFFQTRELLFSDIKGFRVDEKKIRFERLTLHASDFVIWRYTDFAHTDQFIQWLGDHFIDLNLTEYQADLNQILADNSLGITEDERRQKLDTARMVAMIYNIGGVIIFIVSLIYFREIVKSGFMMTVLAVYPLLSPVIIYTSKGLIRFYSDRKSPYYHLSLGIYLSTTVFAMLTIINYQLLSNGNVWYFVPMSVGLSAIFWLADRGNASPNHKGVIFMVILSSLFYSYGALVQLNCRLDSTRERVYHANVTDRYILHNKGTHPYLKIDTWGPQTQAKEIQVDMAFYNQSPIGSAVTVHLKKGVFNIPWYVITPQ